MDAATYYKEGIRLLGRYSYITRSQVIFLNPVTPICMGSNPRIGFDDVIIPIDENGNFVHGPKNKYEALVSCLLEYFTFHQDLSCSSNVINVSVANTTGIKLNQQNDMPTLMKQFIEEHPQYNITKKRSKSGIVYKGLNIKY